ncbi:MAG: PDZ domain-containing protein [Candidatus Acidiferrales bacterium]
MKIRSSSVLSGVALAALLAACVPSGLRAQQQPAPAPQPAPMRGAPDFPVQTVQIDDSPGWLGVAIEEVSADKAKELKLPSDHGVLLTDVDQESPATKAGLKSGDVVTEYDGQRVEGTMAFRRMVRETPPGRSIAIGYWRDGRAGSVNVELGSLASEMQDHARQMQDRADEMAQRAQQQVEQEMAQHPMVFNFPDNAGMFAGHAPTIGIVAFDLSEQLGNYFGAPDGQGVLVSEVREATPAAKAGLLAGDVITKLDGVRVHNVGQLREQLAAKRDAKSVTLTILRRGAELSVPVEPEAPNPPKPETDINRHIAM